MFDLNILIKCIFHQVFPKCILAGQSCFDCDNNSCINSPKKQKMSKRFSEYISGKENYGKHLRLVSNGELFKCDLFCSFLALYFYSAIPL